MTLSWSSACFCGSGTSYSSSLVSFPLSLATRSPAPNPISPLLAGAAQVAQNSTNYWPLFQNTLLPTCLLCPQPVHSSGSCASLTLGQLTGKKLDTEKKLVTESSSTGGFHLDVVDSVLLKLFPAHIMVAWNEKQYFGIFYQKNYETRVCFIFIFIHLQNSTLVQWCDSTANAANNRKIKSSHLKQIKYLNGLCRILLFDRYSIILN